MTEATHPVVEETADGIESMETRGAATIAKAVADAVETVARESSASSTDAYLEELYSAMATLHDTRPTAVTLPNTLRIIHRALPSDESDLETLQTATIEAATSVQDEIDAAQTELGTYGANRLRDGDTVMVHCHSTAVVSCIETATDQGKSLEVIVKETRPRYQGHVTASDLADTGVAMTYIVDSAAHRYLDTVDHVFVGADAICADGSVVNKIGTAGLAVSATARDVPLTVAASTYKMDPGTLDGSPVEIEYRDPTEVLDPETQESIGNPRIENPAFDVTPPKYIDALVTERGLLAPEGVHTIMTDRFGDGPAIPWTEPSR